MTNFSKITCSTIVLAASLASTAVFAQTQQSGRVEATASGWFKTCNERDGSKICNVQFRISANNGANLTTLNLVEVTGKVERRVFQIIVPTGRSLPQGIQLTIDNKRATTIPYLFCRAQGCNAEVRLDDNLVNVFKRGGGVEVKTINFQGQENPVPITLKGFTAAYDGPPLKLEDQATRQQNLADQLKKKAEELETGTNN
ncbi:MAG: invasion associated locus B family protein [Rhizobiaceae bacterium]|nr:invasion associated locus B family protein [Rhizobiaceae bacterium]